MMLRVPRQWALMPGPELAGVDLRRAQAFQHVSRTLGGHLCLRPVFVVQTRSGAMARIISPNVPPASGVLELLNYRDDRKGD